MVALQLREKQVNCIRNLFRRQLSVPLHDSKSALKDYSEWESQHDVKIGDDSNELAGLPLHIATAYKKALEMCSLRETFEEKISEQKQKDAKCLQNYLASFLACIGYVHSCLTTPFTIYGPWKLILEYPSHYVWM